MSSFRNHRVLIASLFLPNTAVPVDDRTSGSLTPLGRGPPPPANTSGKGKQQQKQQPLKSIVDDLVQSSGGSAAPTPAASKENINPFAKLYELAGEPESIHDIATSLLAGAKSLLVPSNATRRTPDGHHHRRPSRKGSRAHSRPAGILNQWTIESNPFANGGLANAVKSVDDKLHRKLWIGALGENSTSFKAGERKQIETRLRDDYDSMPIWIPDDEFSSAYDEFCHQVLWPCLHYAVPDAPKTKSFYESSSFTQYKSVNRKFADALIAEYREGDIIWVNDYHLMLVPGMVREKLPNAIIGFFMHVAFPSSEIFRCLSVREQLLQGLLGSDLIGFQTANFARHFRQTVSRIMSLEALPKGIQLTDSFVDVGVFPIGIDVRALTLKRKEPEVAEWVGLLKQRYTGMKLIVGRDKLDEIQGVRQKMIAFETFLDKYPEWLEKVVLIQVALSTTEENEVQGRVTDIVSRINSRFSTLTYQPVVFLHTHDVSFSQYLALLTVADVFLVTSLREGMALRTHEFVECQEERARPLVLSEFTGSYSYSGFRSCIPINPWDRILTANAIHQALTMPDEEARSRWQDLHAHVVTQTAQTFVTSFLTRCLRVAIEHQQTDSGAIPELDLGGVLPRYKHSSRRLLLIDVEDTLWFRDPRLEDSANPPQDVVDLLKRLSEDRRNEIYLLSGLSKDKLQVIIKSAPNIGLVAENGCLIKPSSRGSQPSQWLNMVVNFDLGWKPACAEILAYFTERTPGSYVEEQEASVAWRFCSKSTINGERQWARRQAAEAQNHIFDSLGERYGLRIVPSENSFLVLPNNISRSSAVGAILHPGGPTRSAAARPSGWSSVEATGVGAEDRDFVLAIGSDEKLLRRLNELDNAETCSTSRKSGSDAKWRIEAKDAAKVLWQFARSVTMPGLSRNDSEL